MIRKDYEKLFARLAPHEPPAWLLNKIFTRIRLEEEIFSVRKRLVLFSSLALVSVAAFVPVIRLCAAEFTQSGFYQFIALFFSDAGAVAANWQDFGMALFESLPATSSVALFATMMMFLWSSKHLAQAMKIIFYSPQVIRS